MSYGTGTSSRQENLSQLREKIERSTAEELSVILQAKICSADFLQILDNYLQCFTEAESSQSKRRKVVQSLLKELSTAKITTQQADRIIRRIIIDFPKYSRHHLTKLVNFCICCIAHDDETSQIRSWKDILPALICLLEREQLIAHTNISLTGPEYKTFTVKSICEVEWNIDALPCLAEMFRDLGLEKNDIIRVLEALCRALQELPLNQIPPVTYQILKLCKHHHTKCFLDSLRRYFQTCYAKVTELDSLEQIGTMSLKEVQDVESTVLYHIHQASELDHEILKDYLRYIKTLLHAPAYVIQPFVLNVLLSATDIYEEQVLDLICTALTNNFQGEDKHWKSGWLRQILNPIVSITEIIGNLITKSNKDRSLVLQGLVTLAFALLSSEKKPKNHAISLWKTGSIILRDLLKKRHETVETILQTLIEKIVSGGQTTTYYTDCLTYACHKLTMVVMDNYIWITTLLERLLFLPGEVGAQVLKAVFPLMHISANIRENLILTLRKALYRTGTAKRKMAITGFLEILKQSRKRTGNTSILSQHPNTSSYNTSTSSISILTQATIESCSQTGRPAPEYNRAPCYEILDILRKSFTYEYEVRVHLYKGFLDIKNPELIEIVLDVLLSQLNCYLETDENILPPLRFHACMEMPALDVVVEEPIGDLIYVVQKIYVSTPSKSLPVLDKTLSVLESLCRRMTRTNLEHFNLDDNIDLYDDYPKTQKKLHCLKLAIMVYEALIAFRIAIWNNDCNDEEINNIEDLIAGYNRSTKFIKESAKPKKTGKKKKAKDANDVSVKKTEKTINIKLPETIMDLETIRKGLKILYSLSSSQLDANQDIHLYMVQTCKELLLNVKVLDEKEKRKLKSSYAVTYIGIGGFLYKNPLTNWGNTLESDEQVAILCLECFKEICEAMCTQFQSELPRFLHGIFSSTDSLSKDVNIQLENLIFSFKRSLHAVLRDNEEDTLEATHAEKICMIILDIIDKCASRINFGKHSPEKIFGWVKKMAQMENVRSSVSPVILQLLLRIEEYTREYGETLNEIANELCELIGPIDEEATTQTKSQYKILTEDISSRAYVILCTFVKEKLDNAVWVFRRIKAEESVLCATTSIKDDHQEKLREKERSLCRQLSYVMQIIHTLTNTAIEPGPCTDIATKNLQQLYNLLVTLTKYFYVKSGPQSPAFQAVKFVQVVQFAGKPLKSAFYNLVTHIEENQNKPGKNSGATAQKNKILRETKVIPRVVYEIEQFHKEILRLSKKTDVPLENYIKHSVTRDFRIKNPELIKCIEQQNVSALYSQNSTVNEHSMHSADTEIREESDQTDHEESRKRQRSSSESSSESPSESSE